MNDSEVLHWLTTQHYELVNDLTATLDLDIGLREVMIQARHRRYVTDVTSVLDVEAGLAAIITRTPDVSTTDKRPATVNNPQFPLRVLAQYLRSASPAVRLMLRASVRAFVHDAELARALEEASREARALAELISARKIDFRDSPDLTTRTRAQDLARNLAEFSANYRDLLNALDSNLAFIIARTCREVNFDICESFVSAKVLASSLNSACGMARDRAFARVLDFSDRITHELGLGEVHIVIYDVQRVQVEDLAILVDAVDDFTDADLREAELSGVPLDGLRWSTATQWPARWVDQVERDSVHLGGGVYEIRPGTISERTTT